MESLSDDGNLDIETQSHRPREDRQVWSVAAVNQERLRTAGKHQKLEEARKESFLEPYEGACPC